MRLPQFGTYHENMETVDTPAPETGLGALLARVEASCGRHVPMPGMRRSAVGVVGLLMVMMPAHLTAQPRAARLAERVRVVTRSTPADTFVGTLTMIQRDTLHVRVYADSTARIARTDVQASEASGGLRDRFAAQNAASIVGVGLGAVAGTAIGVSAVSESGDVFLQFFSGALGATLGIVIGGMLGYGATLDNERERWHAVTLPEPGRDQLPPPLPDSATSARALDAWRASTLPVETRIRVQRVSDAPDVIGSIVAQGDTMLVRRDDAREVRVPWSDVLRVSVSRGLPSRARAVGVSALLGAAAGALTALRLQESFESSCRMRGDCRDGVAYPVAGGVLGALIGAAIGEGRREEQWQVVAMLPTSP